MLTKEKLCEKIYLVLISIYSISSILMSTYIDKIISFYPELYSLIRYLSIVCLLFIFVVNSKLTKKKVIIDFSLLLIICIILIQNNDKSLLIIILLILSFPRNIEVETISKYILLANFFTIVLTFLLCVFNIIPDYVFIQRNILRHGMGFVSANAFSNLVTATVLLFIYFKSKSWKFIYSCLIITILIYVNSITGSRLAFALGIIGVFCVTLKNCIQSNKLILKITLTISKYIFPVLLITLIAITIFINSSNFNGLLGEINSFFSGRIKEMHIFYKQYGINFFGNTIYTLGIKEATMLGKNWVGLDTSYMNYTLRYGIVFMSIISIFYIKIGNHIKKNNLLIDAVYLIIICIMGITENIIFLPHYNLSIFLIAKLFNKNSINEREDERNEIV